MRYVSDMFAHESYRTNWNHGVGPNDVALLKLIEPVTLNENVKLAKLPEQDVIPTGAKINTVALQTNGR